MRILKYFLCLIFINTSVYANVAIKGVIKKSMMVPVDASAELTDGRIDFPKKSYKVNNITVTDLAYVSPKSKTAKDPDLAIFHTAVMDSKLNAIKFNEKTGEFEFRLEFYPRVLVNWQLNTVSVDRIPIKGRVTIDNSSQQLLSGKVKYNNKKLSKFENYNPNFRLEMSGDTLILKAQRDIPVILELKS